MIRHTVIITLDGAEDSLIDSIVDRLRLLPAEIPQIVNYTVGRDLGLQSGPPTIVVVGDFHSTNDYLAYSTNPTHVALIEELIRPNATGLSRAQIEIA